MSDMCMAAPGRQSQP